MPFPPVLSLHVRSHPLFLPLWLPHERVSTQDKRSFPLGPAVSLWVLCSSGYGGHLLQQEPQWQTPLYLMARCAGPAHGVRHRCAVIGSGASHPPLFSQGLVPEQTQALPRSNWTRHTPARQHQPAPRPRHRLVHHVCGRICLVPVSTLSRFHCPRHDEPSYHCTNG